MEKRKEPSALVRFIAWAQEIETEDLVYRCIDEIPREFVELLRVDPQRDIPTQEKLGGFPKAGDAERYPAFTIFSYTYGRWCRWKNIERMPDFRQVFARFAAIAECWMELETAGIKTKGIRLFDFNYQTMMIEDMAPALVEYQKTHKILEAMREDDRAEANFIG